MAYLYFTRHGQTIWNVENKICGASDIVLTEQGYQQATELGEYILKEKLQIDEILYSPLARAAETAKRISEVTNIPARVEERLREQNFGIYESTPRNGEEFQLAKQNFINSYGTGETMIHLCHRVYSLIDEISQSTKTYLLVAHNGISRVIQSYFFDMTNEEFAKFGIKNCEIRRYELQNDMKQTTWIRNMKNGVQQEEIIWVNEEDKIIGYGEKMETHIRKQLHRAFSVFLIKDDKILIQKRAKGKYHSGGLLSNSCCSHPRREEQMEEAITRCLREELSIDVNDLIISKETSKELSGKSNVCMEAGTFVYFADYGELAEHEYDHVYVMKGDFNVQPNPEEIESLEWMTIAEIKQMLTQDANVFSAWFPHAFEEVCACLGC